MKLQVPVPTDRFPHSWHHWISQKKKSCLIYGMWTGMSGGWKKGSASKLLKWFTYTHFVLLLLMLWSKYTYIFSRYNKSKSWQCLCLLLQALLSRAFFSRGCFVLSSQVFGVSQRKVQTVGFITVVVRISECPFFNLQCFYIFFKSSHLINPLRNCSG